MHVPLYVPKWLLYGLLVLGAVCVGWIGTDAFGGPDATSADAIRSDRPVPTTDEGGSTPPQPINLTIMMPPGMMGPYGQPTAMGGAPAVGSSNGANGASGRVTYMIGSANGANGQVRGQSSAYGPANGGGTRVIDQNGRLSSASIRAINGATRLMEQPSYVRRDTGNTATRSWVPSAPVPQQVANHPSAWERELRTSNAEAPTSTSTDIQAPAQVQGMSIIANGDHIVIASDGAIVSVGDNTLVKGNTGDAGASGVIAMDVYDSALTSGDSSHTATTTGSAGGPGGWTPVPVGTPGARVDPQRPDARLLPPAGDELAVAVDAWPLGDPGNASAGRAVGVAGWENHAIDVTGSDNLVTYDDSNLFMNRIGTLNGNTGDTDTSGLNVVDSTRSEVRSGDSGNSDESPDPPPFNPAAPGVSAATGALARPQAGGSSVSVADINGISTATGADSLVIGGDGIDDNGVRVHGDRNVATYDDGNVAIGGIGDVNSQIGDSDTSGAVVMGVTDSNIAAGSSFLPAYQQAGAQVGDPLDGNDPDVSP